MNVYTLLMCVSDIVCFLSSLPEYNIHYAWRRFMLSCTNVPSP